MTLPNQGPKSQNGPQGGGRIGKKGGGGEIRDLSILINKNDSPMSRIELRIITILTPKPRVTAVNDENLIDTKG